MNTQKNSLEYKINLAAQQAITNRVFPGCAISIFSNVHKKFNFEVYAGRNTYETTERKIDGESVFDLASLTKNILHLLVHVLHQRKKIRHDEKVGELLGLRGKWTSLIEIKHLITFSIDFNIKQKFESLYDPEKRYTAGREIMSLIKNADLRFLPGTDHVYRDMTSVLLGMYLEGKFKVSLEELFDEYLFDPLDLASLCFKPRESLSDRYIVPTEEENKIMELMSGHVNDETAGMFLPRNVGCAGLFSRLDDVTKLFDIVLRSYDSKDEHRFFTKETCRLINEDQLNLSEHVYSYGFDKFGIISPDYTKCNYFNYHTMLGTGFSGTSVMIEPIKSKVGIIILSNCLYPKRPDTNEGIKSFRKTIANLVVDQLHEISI